MNLKNIEVGCLNELFLTSTPLIDVRAPVEFAHGSLPNAINLPLLNDDERAQVGTIYKNQGSEAAIRLGHQLVTGSVKEARLNLWLEHLNKNPNAILYCFRGGLRSQITQQWLRDAGVIRPLIIGGYKQARQFLINEIINYSNNHKLLSLYGPTGSGKTQFLEEIKNFYPTLHLETLACHRGSAFGGLATPQPSQVNFENQLAVALITLQNHNHNRLPPLIEDESRLIGRCALPDIFFSHLQQSPVIWLDEPLEQRIENIFQEYIVNSPIGNLNNETALPQFTKYKHSLHSISKKLGGLRTTEILSLIETAETDFIATKNLENNRQWIEKLLVYYYDPLYLKAIVKRQVKVIFKGSKAECLAYLKNGGNHATS